LIRRPGRIRVFAAAIPAQPRTGGRGPAAMRILFVFHKPSFARYFESLLDELGARGHRVHIAIKPVARRETTRRRKPGPELLRRIDERSYALVDRLCERHEGITQGPVPARKDTWTALTVAVRRCIDYLRYMAAAYEHAPKLRARAARHTPELFVRLLERRWVRSPPVVRILDRLLRGLDGAIPASDEVEGFLREQRPDLMLITPLMFEPWQVDYVRSARVLGIRTALCVASWDNLTNKGLIQTPPDRIYVWNEDQRREAVDLHRVPGDRVVATGAQCFDQWFEWAPSSTSAQFRQRLGLPPHGPILLYVCSYSFIAPDEPDFVERWLTALRSHPDERLRSASVLIRPHPKSEVRWDESPLGELPGVRIWPPSGALPTDEDSKSSYFDSIFHSVAVVGINTSALIESAIVGRPVFTVLDPQFEDTQEGTLHFRYLLRANGGPLTVAHDIAEHLEQLRAVLADNSRDTRIEGFVRRFVRPHGLDRPALRVLVEAIDQQLLASPPAPTMSRLGGSIAGVVLRPLATLADRGVFATAARRRTEWWKSTRRSLKPLRRRLTRITRSGWQAAAGVAPFILTRALPRNKPHAAMPSRPAGSAEIPQHDTSSSKAKDGEMAQRDSAPFGS